MPTCSCPLLHHLTSWPPYVCVRAGEHARVSTTKLDCHELPPFRSRSVHARHCRQITRQRQCESLYDATQMLQFTTWICCCSIVAGRPTFSPKRRRPSPPFDASDPKAEPACFFGACCCPSCPPCHQALCLPASLESSASHLMV